MITQDLGIATAYGYAKSKGYTGTEAEFAELMASYADVGQTAVTAAQTATTKASEAATSATTATNKASEATTAATTATTKAGEASTSASTATSAKDTAVSASQTATTKATEATTAAATATSAKTDAVAANTAAQSAKTAAQTAQTGAETAAASVESSAAQIATNAEDISQLKSDLADMESDGAVPSAEQILTDKGVTDCVPYHYRKTGGDGADRLYDQIVGGTVCWNQWVQNGDFADGSNGWNAYNSNNVEASVENGVLTARFLNDSNGGYQYGVYTDYRNSDGTARKPITGHVYMIIAEVKATATGMYGVDTNGTSAGRFSNVTDANVWTSLCKLFVAQNSNATSMIILPGTRITTADTMQIRNVMFIDLTAMFGSAVADYIYQLEQTAAGAGVAWFKSLFPNDYYPYNSGELVSVSGLSAHKMVGFNQWDEEWEAGAINNSTGANINSSSNIRSKGFIPVVPNKQYHVTIPSTGNMIVVYYDANKQATRSLNIYKIYQGGEFNALDSAFVRFYMENTYGTTYNHDICINLSDPAKNGTYEPYKAHSYLLDSTLTLRGLFKLDANNNLYADGDTYEYTGKVTRNTILRAYQSGDESLANAITDGTNTVVYSANASTETADPYQHLQQCDPNGTEEYVSTGIVPVGHNSFYPENLRAKVEGLPWNFANLIAPTESTFTATRNYTTGSLFIVDNVLYKATSNIANGGTITPNTNCTATTLAEIISALA